MSDNPCKWHEIPIKDCLSCNNTPSNIFYAKDIHKEIEWLEFMSSNWENADESN